MTYIEDICTYERGGGGTSGAMIETGVKGLSAPVKSNHTIKCYILLTSIFPCIPKILLSLYACYNQLTLLMIYLSGMEPSCCCGFHCPAAVCS